MGIKVGDILERGYVPCVVCGKPHNRVVVEINPIMALWDAKEGHAYEKVNEVGFLLAKIEKIERLLSGQINRKSRCPRCGPKLEKSYKNLLRRVKSRKEAV